MIKSLNATKSNRRKENCHRRFRSKARKISWFWKLPRVVQTAKNGTCGRKYINEDGFIPATADKASSLIMRSISLQIAAMIPDDEGPEVMWDWLKSQYGADDTFLLKKKLKSVKMNNLNLEEFWENYNMALAVFKSAGGKISYEDQLDILLENIDVEFFLDVIRKIRLETKELEISSKTFLYAKNAIKDFYNATPEKIRNSFKKFELTGKIMENSNYSFNSKNVCEWCQKHGRTKSQHTHKTEKCFYGDKSGSAKFNKTIKIILLHFTILDLH